MCFYFGRFYFDVVVYGVEEFVFVGDVVGCVDMFVGSSVSVVVLRGVGFG